VHDACDAHTSVRAGRRGLHRGSRSTSSSPDRGIISATEWRQRRVRWPVRLFHAATLIFLLVVGLGPVLWMIKSSVTPTQDTLRFPMALWPNGIDLGQLVTAWSRTHIDRYLWNTVVIAFGSWLAQIVVATTAGYALSVLRPRGGGLLMGLVIATLFVPLFFVLVSRRHAKRTSTPPPAVEHAA
jgi:multiple sugar transport system permease protein